MPRPVSAATDFKGMLISPASQNIDLKNGQTYTGQMQVQNTTDGDMNVNMSVGSYVMDDTSTPNYEKVDDFEFVVGDDTDSNTYKLISNAEITAKLKVIKVLKNYAIARLIELDQVSKYRTEPQCSVFKACGGCQLQHINIDGQRQN